MAKTTKQGGQQMSRLLKHYGFRRHPFSRHPCDEALLRHRGFEEAFRRLLFSIELEGIAELLAEAGCGKSLLLGILADELQKQGWVIHYFAHSTVGPFSLVNVLSRKAGLSPRRSRGETAMALVDALMEDERSHLLILDEVHDMPDTTLADVRLLTIADFDRHSPFLLLLAGLPQLDERLAEPLHHALDQRITTLARLQPLSLEETRQYINCRLAAAGPTRQPTFAEGAIDAIFELAGGVPRRINNVATGALIVAASRGRRIVETQDVHDARLDRGRA
jgi:type II secretory pathway predicted ATPase ExeA